MHAKMHMAEKLIQQRILAGMRRNPDGQRFTDFCKRVENTVNHDILGRSSCNAEIGQWRVPLDKKDTKKLGDVKLSGSSATKFMVGLEYLVLVCTEEYSNKYTDKWNLACKRFVDVIKILESKEELSQDAVDKFQLASDEFCDEFTATIIVQKLDVVPKLLEVLVPLTSIIWVPR